MAAMATLTAASMMQAAGLTTTTATSSTLTTNTVRFGPLRLSSNARPVRSVVLVRAAGNPERIDNFVEGAKSDASKNAKNFADAVAEKAGEVQETIKDVGRDMGAKAQEAVDAGSRKVDEAGDKAREVGDEVKTSTKDTLDSATASRSGQSAVVCSCTSPLLLCIAPSAFFFGRKLMKKHEKLYHSYFWEKE